MTNNVIYSTENNLYIQYENSSKSQVNRRCIDGTITGCGNCVGYCQYQEHPGFLTQKQRKEHNCIKKQCHYYLPKPARQKAAESVDNSSAILSLAKRIAKDIDDLSILKIWREGRSWVLGYVTVFGRYDFCDIEQKIREESGSSIIMQKLDYSFENCVELICSGC